MDLNRLKPVINDPKNWQVLMEYYTYLYEVKHKEIENIEKVEDMYRAQGYIRALKELKQIRDKINVR